MQKIAELMQAKAVELLQSGKAERKKDARL